jgi:hypothetical protein
MFKAVGATPEQQEAIKRESHEKAKRDAFVAQAKALDIDTEGATFKEVLDNAGLGKDKKKSSAEWKKIQAEIGLTDKDVDELKKHGERKEKREEILRVAKAEKLDTAELAAILDKIGLGEEPKEKKKRNFHTETGDISNFAANIQAAILNSSQEAAKLKVAKEAKVVAEKQLAVAEKQLEVAKGGHGKEHHRRGAVFADGNG